MNNIIQEKSDAFALRVIGLYKHLLGKSEYVLSKQILRSGTSIGANVVESLFAISKKEFIAKMQIHRLQSYKISMNFSQSECRNSHIFRI